MKTWNARWSAARTGAARCVLTSLHASSFVQASGRGNDASGRSNIYLCLASGYDHDERI
jgi:hypothetical protein